MTAILKFTGVVRTRPIEVVGQRSGRIHLRFEARERDRGASRSWIVRAASEAPIAAARDLRVGDRVTISGSPAFRLVNDEGGGQRLVFELSPDSITKIESVNQKGESHE